MSQADIPRVIYVRDTSNTAGLVGFILSLLGILGTCGLFSPVGFVVSLIGLGKRPRGFAVAGVILGALGSLWLLVLALIALVAGVAGLIGVVGTAVETGSVEAAFDRYEVAQIVRAVDAYEDSTQALPTTIEQLGLKGGTLEDRWGNTYRYEPDFLTGTYRISSHGPDGMRGTDDDILLYDSTSGGEIFLEDDPAFREFERRLNEQEDAEGR